MSKFNKKTILISISAILSTSSSCFSDSLGGVKLDLKKTASPTNINSTAVLASSKKNIKHKKVINKSNKEKKANNASKNIKSVSKPRTTSLSVVKTIVGGNRKIANQSVSSLNKNLVKPNPYIYLLRPNFGYFPPKLRRLPCYHHCMNFLKFKLKYFHARHSVQQVNDRGHHVLNNYGANNLMRECYQQCRCSYDWSSGSRALKIMCDSRKKRGAVVIKKDAPHVAWPSDKGLSNTVK